ncbi:MAG: hypothetical protein ACM34B_17815 [Nitrospira sp.]
MIPDQTTRTFTIDLPADVLEVLDVLRHKIPKKNRAQADRRLEREVMMAILRFHSDEGRRYLGIPMTPMEAKAQDREATRSLLRLV